MSADNRLICTPMPEAPEAPQTPDVSDERSRKTEIMNRVEPGGWSMATKVIVGLLVLGLLAGVAFAIVEGRLSSGSAASVSTETVARAEGSSGSAATATEAFVPPAECQGADLTGHTRWYCQDFLPFATKAAADHDRLDRLEAQLKESKDTGNSRVPLALWIVVIFIGVMTVYNTVQNVSMRKAQAPTEPKPDAPEPPKTEGP